ncbi:MAG: DUF423 domain-containing protein [Chitinophagales bacterium]|nr:DUF423 domain-containing protein [Chitinophagales bacterium]
MHKNFLLSGAMLGALAVALGAFGAHGLQRLTDDEAILKGYQTAAQYQMYHALALLAVGILAERFHGKLMIWAGACFITGIFLFSGSLYLLTYLKIQASTAVKFVGPVTPVGGIFFIVGWLLLFAAIMKRK